MVWGVAIVAGAKVHDKQSQADNNSSNIYHHLPPNVDLNRCRLQRCLTTGHLLAELLANVAYYKLLFAWPGMVWSAADTFARRPAALYYSFKWTKAPMFWAPGMLPDSSEKKKEDIVDSNQGGGRVSLFVFVALKLFRLLVPHMMLLYLDFLKDGQNTSGVMFYLEVCFPDTKRIWRFWVLSDGISGRPSQDPAKKDLNISSPRDRVSWGWKLASWEVSVPARWWERIQCWDIRLASRTVLILHCHFLV